jgi:hypothetical protein
MEKIDRGEIPIEVQNSRKKAISWVMNLSTTMWNLL